MAHGAGEYEAVELRDGDAARFKGKGVLKAIDNIHNILTPAVLGMDPTDQEGIDNALVQLDACSSKSTLGLLFSACSLSGMRRRDRGATGRRVRLGPVQMPTRGGSSLCGLRA